MSTGRVNIFNASSSFSIPRYLRLTEIGQARQQGLEERNLDRNLVEVLRKLHLNIHEEILSKLHTWWHWKIRNLRGAKIILLAFNKVVTKYEIANSVEQAGTRPPIKTTFRHSIFGFIRQSRYVGTRSWQLNTHG